MLNILGMIIFIIILFIIILLIIGIRISLEYSKKGSEVKGCLKILIFRKIKVYSRQFPSDEDDEEEEEEDDEDEDHLDIKELYRLARPCFNDFMNYLKSVFGTITIKRMDNHLIFGLDSYADTGKYIGIIWGVLSLVNPMHEKLMITAEPSFEGSVLDGYGTNHFDIYPLKLLVPTAVLVSKKDVRKFIRGVLDER